MDAYRIFLGVFVSTIGLFVFCNVTKTKYLQIVTTLMRSEMIFILTRTRYVLLLGGRLS